MARDYFQAAIESEIKHYPGADFSLRRRSRHREAVLEFKGRTRNVVIPSSGSDHRGPKNALTQVKKALSILGAERLDKVPVSKREVRIMKSKAPARLAITKRAIMVVIPEASPFFKRVVAKGQPKSYWSVELRSNPDPKGSPFLAIVEQPAPAPGTKHQGVVRGFYNRMAKAAYLQWSAKEQFPNIVKHGPFGVTPVELKADEGQAILFHMPTERKALMLRGKTKAEALAAAEKDAKRLEADAGEIEAREAEAVAEAPVAEAPAPVAPPEADMVQALLARLLQQPQVLQPQVHLDKPITLMPREAVSMERAVNALNALKNKHGEDIQFVVGAGGFLVVRAKLGGMPR